MRRVWAVGLHPSTLAAAAYLIVTAVTKAQLAGDGPIYAAAIFNRFQSGADGWAFWDAGHLIWRPIGYLVILALAKVTGTAAAAVPLATIGRALILISWAAGALCVVMVPLWLRRLGVSALGALLAAIALMAANGFLQYYQSGLSYIPAIACLVVGLYLLSGDAPSPAASTAAGVSFALAVLLWLPFICALPSALAYPLLRGGLTRGPIRAAARAVAACALLGLTAYGAVLGHLHIASADAFAAWLADASHHITRVSGLPRAAFGFGRSFLNMGTDGALMKRYLLHDPYNPVSFADLLRASLGKLLFFYFVVAAMATMLWRSRAHRPLWFCIAAGIPVLAFAVAWQGGDTERYFPLYPAFLLALGMCFARTRDGLSRGSLAPGAFVALALVVNVPAYSRRAAASAEADIVSRVSTFSDGTLPARSVVVTPSWNDAIVAYFNSGATAGLRLHKTFPIYGLMQPGVEYAPRWRQDFATRALEALDSGGRIWLSRRLLHRRPEPSWGWVEGDDTRLSWSDFPSFFSALALGEVVGGPDGFVEILPTDANYTTLRRYAPLGR